MSNRTRRHQQIRGAILAVVVIGGLIFGYFTYSRWVRQERLLPASFITESGAKLGPVRLEIASTASERHVGLMYRREMDPNEGMLFIFPKEELQEFWMKNTYLSLDMLFLDSNLKIVGILSNVPPLTEDRRGVPRPSQYVIELLAGRAKQLGLKEGQRVEFSRPIPRGA